MEKNTITICQNEIHLERYVNQHQYSYNVVTLFEFISNQINNYFLANNISSKRIINAFEEFLILKDIINENLKNDSDYRLYDIDSITKYCQDAYVQITENLTNINEPIFNSTSENKFLKKIILKYLEVLKDSNYITYQQAILLFISEINYDQQGVKLIGFKIKTPLSEKIKLKLRINSPKKDKVKKHSFLIDEYNELKSEFSHVLKKVYDEFLDGKKIAVVSQQIEENLDNIRLTLSDPALIRQKNILNMPFKESLINSSIVQHLLTYLDLKNLQYVELSKVKMLYTILKNPNITNPYEKLFANLYKSGIKKVNNNQLNNLITSYFEDSSYVLINSEGAENFNINLANWSKKIIKQLDNSLFNDIEFQNEKQIQQIDEFRKILDLAQTFKTQSRKLSYYDFRSIIIQFIKNSRIKTEYFERGIDLYGFDDQIIGKYDSIYIIDFIDRPSLEVQKNPFIPNGLFTNIYTQSFIKEHVHSQLIDYQKNTHNLNISYSKNKNEIENTINKHVSFKKITQVNPLNKYGYLNDNTTIMESDNNVKYTIKDNKINNLRNVLENYQLCPRLAFFENVLHCRKIEIESPETMNNKLRGILIHESLKNIYSEDVSVKSDIQESKIIAALTHCITNNFRFKNLHKSTREFEIKYCTDMIKKLINIEKMRDDFKVISCEQKESYSFSNINFNLILDRVDVDEKSVHIIDYKTGKLPTTASWTEAPFKDFQIPLYLCFPKHRNTNLMLYQIKDYQTSIKKYYFDISGNTEKSPHEDIQIVKIKKDFSELKKLWMSTFEEHIHQFISGNFKNTFENENDLMFKDSKILLRIPERNFLFELNYHD